MEIKTCINDEMIQEVAQLAETIWKTCYVGIITEEQATYMIEKFQSFPVIKNAINQEQYTYFGAYENDQMVGYCGVQIQNKRLFLSKLYLLDSSRGKGIGLRLLNHAIQFGKDHKMDTIYLTVNKQNEHGISIYQRSGFKTIDAVRSDIGHGYIMDDYIMERNICIDK